MNTLFYKACDELMSHVVKKKILVYLLKRQRNLSFLSNV